jgi:hypothetical protein
MPEQLVLPFRVTVPRGPEKVCCELHDPFAQEPWPEELQVLPLGPVALPERLQPPASAMEAAPTKNATATARRARMELLSGMISLLLTPQCERRDETEASPLP